MTDRMLSSFIKKISDSEGTIESFWGRLVDITDHKQSGQALRESEEKYRRLVESIHDGIWVIDKYAYTTFVNPRMAEMLGYTAEEMLGKHLFSFMDERGVELATYYLERRRQGIKERHEFEFLRKDGVRIYTTLETSPLTDEEGRYVGAIASVQDITDRKRMEEELEKVKAELETKVNERTEELKTLNKRLRSMAIQLSLAQAHERRRIATWLHDSVNQNLASCAMKLQTLMQQVSSTEFDRSLQEIHDTIQETIKEMRSLTFQLSPPILYEMGLEAALEELTRMFKRDYGLKCIFQTDGEPKPLDKDMSILLYQATRELLRNVIKHAKAKRVVVETLRLGDEVRIIVSDDGVGFDSEIILGSKKSKGFGLFSIRELIKDLGGQVETESNTEGTTIVLIAPLEQQQATEV